MNSTAVLSDTTPPRRSSRFLWRYLGPLLPAVILLTVVLLSSTGLNLYLPQILAQFIDQAKLGQAAELNILTRLAFIYLGCALGIQLLTAVATYLGAHVGWIATNRLRADLLEHTLSLDMSEHKERTPGEMIERIDGDVTALSNFFSKFSVEVFGAMLLLVGALVMFFLTDWRVGLGVSLFAVLTLWGMNHVRQWGVEPSRLEREASAQMYGYIEERLTGLDDVRSLGAGTDHLRGFLVVQAEFFRRTVSAWLARVTVWKLSMLAFMLGYSGILIAATGLYTAGTITLGTAFLLFQYMSKVEDPIDRLTQQLQDLQKASAGVQRIAELLQLRSELPSGAKTLPAGPLEVRFDGVSFAYSSGTPNVLKEVAFTLPAGQSLGLLGRTGSGKTTLTRLIARLHDPSSGQVLLADVPTEQIDSPHLRTRVAVVTQDVQLFQASVRDNLTLFDEGLTDALAMQALEDVGLLPWFERLENGLDTLLPAGSLSAGQAQLLAFARILLRDPSVIILDEPSSRLDPATEGLLTHAMNKLLHGRTALIIAHRLETVARVDRILVLGSGEILEDGAREQLAQQPDSHYAKLLQASKNSRAGQSDAVDDILS